MRNIALMGRAGAGKDTAASWLMVRDGYGRVAFADPLKRMALNVNPIVDAWDSGTPIRLVDAVNVYGWDVAKRRFPEVRRFLQRLGLEGVREVIGDHTWIALAGMEIARHGAAGRPVVVTDVRFRNELDTLQDAGFLALWIDRPGIADGDHASEAELTAVDADALVHNDGSPERLHRLVRFAATEFGR